jgi:hypothetical protein
MKKKQENIDKEIGMTFNPLLINGDKYLDKIDRNFYKREKKFMQNQRNHIEAYQNYLDKEKEKYFKKFYENKKTIVKNVVDRLYKDGLEKTGILIIPKMTLVTALSIRLGIEAQPIVGSFEIIGFPVGPRGNTSVCSITFLEDNLRSDI